MSLNGLEAEVKSNLNAGPRARHGRSGVGAGGRWAMTRDVDETYWHDYFRTHNERRFKELVTGFYAEDALFSNPKAEARGREQIIAFLEGANRDVQIDLLPSSILVQRTSVRHARPEGSPGFSAGADEDWRGGQHAHGGRIPCGRRPHRTRPHLLGTMPLTISVARMLTAASRQAPARARRTGPLSARPSAPSRTRGLRSAGCARG
jgi:hypothetical protein